MRIDPLRLKVIEILQEMWSERPKRYDSCLNMSFSHYQTGIHDKNLAQYKERLDKILNIRSVTLMRWFCNDVCCQPSYKWHQDEIRSPNSYAYVLGYPYPTEFIPSNMIDFSRVIKNHDDTVTFHREYEKYAQIADLGEPLLVDSQLIHRTNNQHPSDERMCVKLVCTKS